MHAESIQRPGWTIYQYAALALAAAISAASGLYLSGVWHSAADSEGEHAHSDLPTSNSSRLAMQRFALSGLDVKDQVEAPSVAVDTNGRVFLTWASKTGEAERTIFVARSSESGWPMDSPHAASRAEIYKTGSRSGRSGGFERRATPHIDVLDGSVCLAWSEATQGGAGLRMVMAKSADSGKSFGPPMAVHQGDRAKPTFTSLSISPRGHVACAWLDDRAGFQQPFVSSRQPHQTQFETEQLVHAGEEGLGVCPCCPVASLIGPDDTLYVAFRNISGGYRDIAICRKKPGQSGFEPAVPVVQPTWQFDGCPHDGPSMAIAGDALHVVWMDARTGSQRCYYGRSGMDKLQFTCQELHGGGSSTQGNARLLTDGHGCLHAVWEESLGPEAEPSKNAGHQHGAPATGTGGGRAIYHAIMHRNQKVFSPPQALAPRSGAFQTRPAIAVAPDRGLIVAWNEWDENGKSIVLVRTLASTPTQAASQP